MEENTLRLILLVVGIVIIASIYLFDKFKKKPARRVNQAADFVEEAFEKARNYNRPTVDPELEKELLDIEPMSAKPETIDPESIDWLTEESGSSGIHQENNELSGEVDVEHYDYAGVDRESEPSSSSPGVEPASLILQLNVTALSAEGFAGAELLSALTDLGLEYGEMGIFHCYDRGDDQQRVWFHLVNMVEPGTFPIGTMQDFRTPGVSLFFQSSEVDSPHQVFNDMLNTAERLADVLSGQVLNQQREPLSRQDLDHIGEQLRGATGLLQ